MDWLYAYIGKDGQLYEIIRGKETKHRVLSESIRFNTVQDAEQYCEKMDYRITVQY